MPYGTVNADIVSDSNGGVLAPISSVMRNRIINGAMVIDQRNAGASVTNAVSTITYTLDRWVYQADAASKFTIQQNAGSVTPPVGFTNYLGVTSLSAYSIGTGNYNLITQRIEGFNVADLGWGTANAKTVTISFWVRSSLTGTFGGAISNSAQNRSYPFSYTISSANTWTTISVTIAGDTTGTWIGATNGIGLVVNFGLGVGSTSSGTAGAWAGANYLSSTGATSVVGTNGATFYITGVQLEVGSSATGFEYRQYTTELQLCQRYYEVQGFDVNALTVAGTNYGIGAGNLAYYESSAFAVVKRATPTVSISGTWTDSNTNGTVSVSGSSRSNYVLQVVNGGAAGNVITTTSATSGITASIEL